MRGGAAAAALLAAFACGCVQQPDTYRPPVPRKPFSVEAPATLKSWLAMNDPQAPYQFLRDIRPTVEGGVWRWAGRNPAVMLAAPKTSAVRFAADIAVPEITMKDTGPVTIKVVINGRELLTQRYDTPGNKRIEQPVPDGWLKTPRENVVSLEIDKVWTSPHDGTQFGFVLTALGFLG